MGDPVTAAIIIGAVTAGSTAYSVSESKKARQAQSDMAAKQDAALAEQQKKQEALQVEEKLKEDKAVKAAFMKAPPPILPSGKDLPGAAKRETVGSTQPTQAANKLIGV